jgi:protein-S-isoprenylcysteine O-methyltransferase Ste14
MHTDTPAYGLWSLVVINAAVFRLARREEREVLTEFGETYARYAANTPAFVPRMGRQVEREA